MNFHPEDFGRATGLPDGIDINPGVKDCYAFALDYGPRLIGPVRVEIKVHNVRKNDEFGKLFIEVGEDCYWNQYGKESNQWAQSSYYLVFVTQEQLDADPGPHYLMLPAQMPRDYPGQA